MRASAKKAQADLNLDKGGYAPDSGEFDDRISAIRVHLLRKHSVSKVVCANDTGAGSLTLIAVDKNGKEKASYTIPHRELAVNSADELISLLTENQFRNLTSPGGVVA